MINYYAELNISQSLSGEEMEAALRKAKKQWGLRMGAPALARRQEAERKVALIDEAAPILCDKAKKAKYDKELAKNGGAASATNTVDYTAQQAQAANASTEVLIQLAEDMYNSGSCEDAINTCNRVLGAGVKDRRIYYVLGMSYLELDNVDAGLRVFQNAVAENPEDTEMILYLARLCAQMGRLNEAENYVKNVLASQPDNTFALATVVELELIKKYYVKADQLVSELKAKYPGDKVFTSNASGAYMRAANKLITIAKNGAGYLATQEDADMYLKLVTKAQELDPSEYTNKELVTAQDEKKKAFDPSNWKGVICLIGASILSFLAIEEYGVFLFIVTLLVTGVLCYFNMKEKWRIRRKVVTGKNDPIDYLMIILGLILVIVGAIIKFTFKIAQEGLKMSYNN